MPLPGPVVRAVVAVALASASLLATAWASERAFLTIEAGHHTAPVFRVAVSPDQSMLATASDDKTVRLWAPTERRLLGVLRGPIGEGETGRAYGVAFSPDGQEVAVAGTTGALPGGHRISVYRTDGAAFARALPLDAGDVVRLLWTRSGEHLAACLRGSHGLRIVPNQGGEAFADGFDAACSGLAELPDGSLLASGYDGRIRHYQRVSGRWTKTREFSTGERSDPRSMAVSPDGRFFAVGYFSPLGAAVGAGGAPSAGPGQTVVDVFSTASFARERRFAFTDVVADGSAGLGSVAWSADGRVIAAAGRAQERSSQGYRTRVVLKRIDWQSGAVQSDFVSTDTVHDIVPWGASSFMLAHHNGAWSVAPAQGPVEPAGATRVDLRGPAGLALDAKASTVSFAADSWSGARHFALPTRALEAGRGDTTRNARTSDWLFGATRWQDNVGTSVAGRPVALAPGEFSRSFAVLPDNLGALLGTNRSLRRFGRDGVQVWSVPAPFETWAVGASADGRIAVSAHADGTIRWWRAADGALLLSLFVALDGRWVLWTPEGQYDTSAGGETLIGWHVNRDDGRTALFQGVAAFRDRFHRPDVIDRVLEQLDVAKAVAAADAERQRVAAAVPSPAPPADVQVGIVAPRDEMPATRLPPTLHVLAKRAARSETRTLGLDFTLRAGHRPVQDIIVRIDGRPATLQSLQMPQRQDGEALGRLVLQMPERDAELTVIARSEDLLSEPVFLPWRAPVVLKEMPAQQAPQLPVAPPMPERLAQVQGLTLALPPPTPPLLPAPPPALAAPATKPPAAASRGRLFVLAVGISVYADKAYALDFPAKDARDFTRFMQSQAGRLYASVEVRLLTDAQARRPAMLEALDWLQRSVGEADTGILFLSGHGLNDARGQYFFLTHESDLRQLGQTAVAQHELRTKLAGLKGRALMFVDTCHSGNALGSSVTLSRDTTGLSNDLSSAGNGVIFFSASTGKQEALEMPHLGNGTFTKALIEGLSGGADFRKEGMVTHQGLNYFLGERVRKLSLGRQTPAIGVPQGMIDFALVAL